MQIICSNLSPDIHTFKNTSMEYIKSTIHMCCSEIIKGVFSTLFYQSYPKITVIGHTVTVYLHIDSSTGNFYVPCVARFQSIGQNQHR